LNKILGYNLKKREILFVAWVLNGEEEFEKAIKQNFTGIMTDKPTNLRDFLKRRNLNYEG